METIIVILVNKLLEILVKYAERKFVEAGKGTDKKAYVIRKIEDFFGDEELEEFKDKAVTLAEDKIEDVVAKVINKN